MLTNVIGFFFIFLIIALIYFLFPPRFQRIYLLLISVVIYLTFIPKYLIVILFLIISTYILAILINSSSGLRRKHLLTLSILIACLPLILFKYLNFFEQNLEILLKMLDWNYQIRYLNLILPVGLSFQTFEAISYLIEVYKRRQEVEKDLSKYGLFILFFPQLMSGPIERPQHMLPQYNKTYYFDYKRVSDGLKLICWGIFKKVVVADRLAVFVNEVYNSPVKYSSFTLILATFFFAYQIYCDFSGYSDIAVGQGKVLGYELVRNFNCPYFSKSVSDFWRRWHISLFSWFRDYIYIPLGGNRLGILRKYFNIFVTFSASGLWHGASWTYIFWGWLNGVYLILEDSIKNLFVLSVKKTRPNFIYVKDIIKVFFTFILVCLAWVMFRADSSKDAFYIYSHLFGKTGLTFNQPRLDFAVAFWGIIIVWVADLISLKRDLIAEINKNTLVFRWIIYIFLIMSIILLKSPTQSSFIYYQF